MEKPIIIEPDYWGVLVQWVLFFGIFAIVILPAFLYKTLAKRFNKKGWVYFIWGLLVGVIGLNIVHWYAGLVSHFTSQDMSEVVRYSWLLSMYLLGYLFVWAAYKILLAHLVKQKNKERTD